MNDMTPVPRHRQAPISFRSDLAERLLERITADGKSQAQVIEEALANFLASEIGQLPPEERNARIDAIVKPWHGLPGKTRVQIEAEIYDENGLPR